MKRIRSRGATGELHDESEIKKTKAKLKDDSDSTGWLEV